LEQADSRYCQIPAGWLGSLVRRLFSLPRAGFPALPASMKFAARVGIQVHEATSGFLYNLDRRDVGYRKWKASLVALILTFSLENQRISLAEIMLLNKHNPRNLYVLFRVLTKTETPSKLSQREKNISGGTIRAGKSDSGIVTDV